MSALCRMVLGWGVQAGAAHGRCEPPATAGSLDSLPRLLGCRRKFSAAKKPALLQLLLGPCCNVVALRKVGWASALRLVAAAAPVQGPAPGLQMEPVPPLCHLQHNARCRTRA